MNERHRTRLALSPPFLAEKRVFRFPYSCRPRRKEELAGVGWSALVRIRIARMYTTSRPHLYLASQSDNSSFPRVRVTEPVLFRCVRSHGSEEERWPQQKRVPTRSNRRGLRDRDWYGKTQKKSTCLDQQDTQGSNDAGWLEKGVAALWTPQVPTIHASRGDSDPADP